MGRRRTEDGADHLSAMVRRKNAVNEELTLAARSQNVWAAVESGKERRRRLACEREYGVGRPGFAPAAPPTQAPAPVQQKAIPAPAEVKPAVQKNPVEPSKPTAQANVAAPAEVKPAAKKGKAAKDVTKPKKSDEQEQAERVPVPPAPVETKQPEIAAAASVKPVVQAEKQDKEELKTTKPVGAATPPSKPVDTSDAKQNDDPKQDNKKSKRGKKKGGRLSESDDKPVAEPASPASKPEAPLASNLPKMVSDEPSPAASALSPAPPAAPVPIPCAPAAATLSYAEKAKHPPASPPQKDPPPPPPREESPEPLYDPVPRAHSPPPAPALAACSPVTEDWMPVETRKEKRRRRRSERASESERKSESAAEPDAFDLLLSGGEGLHDGLQEILDEEEGSAPPPPPPAAASAKAGDAFDLLLSGGEGLHDGLQEILDEEEGSAPPPLPPAPAAASAKAGDAFDLLLSAADDLGEGFQEAFGDEDEEPAQTNKGKSAVKGKTAKPDGDKKKGKGKQDDTKRKNDKPAAPVLDAFDLMLGGDDGLKEGFDQAFADDSDKSVKSPVTTKAKGQEKSKAKPVKGNKREHKTSQSDKKSAPVANANTGEEKQQEETRKTEETTTVASEAVPKPHQHDAQVHDKSKKPRSRKNSEKTREKGRTPRQRTCSESEPHASVAPTAETAEDMWFDKTAHDAAEVSFHEDAAASAIPEEVPEPEELAPQSEKPQAKGKKPRSRKNSEKTKQGRTPRESTCSESEPPAQVTDTVTWFDKAVYDAAETRFYEGMCVGSGQPENQQGVLKKTSATPDSQPLSRSSQQRVVEDVNSPSSQSSVEVASSLTSPSTASPPAASPVAASSTTSPSPAPHQATPAQPAPSAADVPPVDICSPPMSLSSQPEQYFEDVVLAARKSSTTMAELPGFTAAPLSERLAPGEQLDSLRTEPELEPEEPSDSHKAGKKRQRRRRRRSDRTSESDRKSESEPVPPARPEAVVGGTVPGLAPEETENDGETIPAKATSVNSAENGAEPKSQQKSSKPRHQRRKKTKSTSSNGEPTENGTVLHETAAASTASSNHVQAATKVAPIPEAPAASPTTAKPAVKATSVSSTAGSESQPSSPEHLIGSSPEHEGTQFVPDDSGRQYASLLQQDTDTMLPARPVFLAHACFVCKRLHGKQCRLKSCGSCRLVAYCSATHQRAHWPLHRALCKVITKRMKKLDTDHLYREAHNVTSHEQWKQIRFKHMTVCEDMLGRSMEAYEKEMFLYPRACETCHETTPEKLHTCHSCHSVSYCSEEHLRKNHAKFCKDLRLLVDIHTYQNQHGVCDPLLPDKMLTTYEQLASNIREFLVVSMLGPVKACAMGNIELAVLSEQPVHG